jgi:hypothetical protein
MGYCRIVVGCVAIAAVCAAAGCKMKLNRSGSTDEAAATTASAAVAAQSSASASPVVRNPRPRPSGPSFAVMAGEGLGPIRFGSTVATVERHMQSKCEELSEKRCRYISAGIELELTNGAVSGMVVHRFERPVEGSPDKKWGMFAGGIPPKVTLMLVPEAVIEELGQPRRTEEVTGENPNWTVRRDIYDGLVLEYDKNRANDRLMLGSIRVVKH